jgi:hypothetical protein
VPEQSRSCAMHCKLLLMIEQDGALQALSITALLYSLLPPAKSSCSEAYDVAERAPQNSLASSTDLQNQRPISQLGSGFVETVHAART